MSHLTVVQNKLYLAGLMLLVLLLAACGGGAQNATTEEPEEEPTSDVTQAPTATRPPTSTPTELPVPAGTIADTFPCEATIINSDDNTLNIRFREPTNDMSLMIGMIRPNTVLRLFEMTEFEGNVWYRTINPGTNGFFGWIKAEYLNLSEGCVAGAAGGAEATDEADAEATEASDDAEATEANDEATEEATEESD